MMAFMGLSLQCILDLIVAGISLVIGLGFFAFITSILCSVAFLHNSKALLEEKNRSNDARTYGSAVRLS
ncbi:uncharacterized protein LOC112098834 [Citrus clementina]|uniref:uncharacterized protein LOC112098834 n=1 Tax=Citrus clementina TaxID=85681 RepID=UPI000CED6EC3|nr:uncharacterized protein LOC112098834 [Citrus x clementina]